MTFKDFIKEKEERELDIEADIIFDKVRDLIKNTPDLDCAKLHEFAKSELEITPNESETIIFQMLYDYIDADKSLEVKDDTIGDADDAAVDSVRIED